MSLYISDPEKNGQLQNVSAMIDAAESAQATLVEQKKQKKMVKRSARDAQHDTEPYVPAAKTQSEYYDKVYSKYSYHGKGLTHIEWHESARVMYTTSKRLVWQTYNDIK